MRITFEESFRLPVEEIFGYFRTPADWIRLYGMFGDVEDRGGGWVAVPLKGFPFPLVARITHCDENARVCWVFRGFWRGEGEVRFTSAEGVTRVEGHEDISIRWLGPMSPLVERLLLEKQFRRIWRYGWKRLRATEPPA